MSPQQTVRHNKQLNPGIEVVSRNDIEIPYTKIFEIPAVHQFSPELNYLHQK